MVTVTEYYGTAQFKLDTRVQQTRVYLTDFVEAHASCWHAGCMAREHMHVLIDYDEIIALSYPIQLTIRIQTTSEGGLTEFAFNSNRLNANSVWTQLMRIDSHSMRIIFVV